MMPARALEPVNCSISVGSTGMTMPIDRTSSIAVTRMNAIAALLARKATGGMGLDSEVGAVAARRAGARKARPGGGQGRAPARRAGAEREVGGAAWRESVCAYVSSSVVEVAVTQNKT